MRLPWGISDWVYEASGIEIPKEFIRFDVYQNHRGGLSAEGRIKYRGPLQQRSGRWLSGSARGICMTWFVSTGMKD